MSEEDVQGTPSTDGLDLKVQEGGNEISMIVKLFNKHLGTSYSLVEFDSFSGMELLQKLNDVFAELTAEHKLDVAQEASTTGGMGTTLTRMTNFLQSILNYKLPNSLKPDFEQNFVAGEKQLLYPILHWVLMHMTQNRKRVYLSKYLIPVEVPEDLRASDDGVREVFNQYKQLTSEFVQTHRTVEKLKESVANPQDIGKVIKTLEQERETLKQRITTTKEKLKAFPQWEALLKAAHELRQSTEEQIKNTEQLESQGEALYQAELKLSGSEQTLKELKRDMNQAFSAGDMLRRMQEDIRMSHMLLDDKLPKDVEQRRQQLQTLHTALNETVDEIAVQQQIERLEQDIGRLKRKKEERMKDKEAQQLQLFRQQASLTAGRKAGFHDELQNVKAEIAKIKDAISGKEDDLSRFSNEKIPKGEDFVKYVNSLRENYSSYKRMGAELGELRAEFGVLQRTEELLLGKVDKKEFQGLREAAQQLEQLNGQIISLDEKKSAKLEKLSEVVQEFVAEITERRTRLAPQILELRNTRQKAQVVETAYLSKKETYEAEQSRLDADTGKLNEEVNALESDSRLYESLYHRLNCQLNIASVAWNRVKDEKDFSHGERRLDDKYETWTKMFESVTKDLEQKAQALRIQRKDIEQNHDGNLQQMEWFRNLRRLLECKVNHYKRENTESDKGTGDMLSEGMVIGGTGNATVMVL
ncbi:Intraflagellar transport protein 81 [Diplonema papillatum]|nr:Intraflagellar transport protein 81 [Diplonema papillatum]